MPKTEQTFDLALRDRSTKVTRFRWLYDELRSAILDGRLRPETRLPSSRRIARHYQLARGTVVAAFEQLNSEGFIESRVGNGTFVKHTLSKKLLGPKSGKLSACSERSRATISSRGQRLRRNPFPMIWSNREARSFRIGLPGLDSFPTELWSRIAARRIRQATPSLLSYGDTLGYRPLRAEIASYVGLSRGFKCTEDEIVVTSGTQQSLDLISRLVLDRSDRVWMEDPGYPAAVSLFRAVGAEVIGVPVDDKGLNLAPGKRKLKSAKLAYVTPGCQFPLGVTMSLERRREILQWAQNENAWIFEDDYDGEFGFSGRPLTALKSMDECQCVIYSNSFNKVLFPTLRLGYLVVPPRLIDAVAAAKSITDRFPPVLDQAILCDFISEGHFGRHIFRMREIYAERFDTLIDCSRLKLEHLMDLSPKFTGLQTIGWLKGIKDTDACRLAASRGIDSVALSKLMINRSMPPAMILGIAYADVQTIRQGIDTLASVLRELKFLRR